MIQLIQSLTDEPFLDKSKLLDSVIALQLQKIINYNSIMNDSINSHSEEAMHNLIELLKMRK